MSHKAYIVSISPSINLQNPHRVRVKSSTEVHFQNFPPGLTSSLLFSAPKSALPSPITTLESHSVEPITCRRNRNGGTHLRYSRKLTPGVLSASFFAARSSVLISPGATPLTRATMSRTSSSDTVEPAMRT